LLKLIVIAGINISVVELLNLGIFEPRCYWWKGWRN